MSRTDKIAPPPDSPQEGVRRAWRQHLPRDPLVEQMDRDLREIHRRNRVRMAALDAATTPSTAPFRVRCPALAAWRDRLRSGGRGQRADVPATWLYDDLWRAACWEASAMELAAAKQYGAADRARARAKELLLKAAA